MEKPDTSKTRHLRLEMKKRIAPGITVTILYEDEAEVIEKLKSWGFGNKPFVCPRKGQAKGLGGGGTK